MKDEILRLRNKGMSYNQISKELKCAISTISYHCGVGQKEKSKERAKSNNKNNPLIKKVNNFKSRHFKLRIRDFQRKTNKGVYVKGVQKNFNYKDVLNKIGRDPRCYLTGERIDLKESSSYHFDHIIPRSKGGSNELDNLNICLSQVNKSKGNLLNSEFLDLCQKVLEFNGYTVGNVEVTNRF